MTAYTKSRSRIVSSTSATRLPEKSALQRTNNITKSFSTVIKPWPSSVVESKGDYREEAYLEDVIGGPLYSEQKNLMKLPIPEIEETIAKFLPTALPLAESEAEAHSLQNACTAFPKQAAELQNRLQKRMNEEMSDSSWLQLWWNTAGYLQVRDPVVVNVSYFFHFSDDTSLPLESDGKSFGVMRGAAILSATAEFRKLVCSGDLPCDKIGRKEPKTPLCSTAFKYMFNSCRIPRREHDTYKMYDPSLQKHCVVSVKGIFFELDFMDENGDALPLDVIEDRLQQCVDQAESLGDVPKIGFLTSDDRDSCADYRSELIRVGGERMEKALEKLESGAILLCLDDEEPVSRKQCADIFWTGALTSGENRWFDKSIQIMVGKNGKAGLIGEHSMMDGMPMIGYADFVTKQCYSKIVNKKSNNDYSGSNSVQNIFKDCIPEMKSGDSQVSMMVERAKSNLTKLVSDHSLDVLSFQGYGSDYIKSVGYSPDAYVQMAIQLATYRLFGKQVGTYEATQMRPFLHGRTETTRSVSVESSEFVKAMGFRPQFNANDQASRERKLSLLRDAVGSHVKYIVNAGKGNGVDRHFFGLSMLVKEGEQMPELYTNPLFIRSKTWRVSTSHLTHPKFDNWGFGEVVSNGVGVGYGVKNGSCIFNITALKEHDWTDRLSHLLEEALLEMQMLNDLSKPPSSKL